MKEVKPPSYWYLRCETCKEDFPSLLATSEDELTAPDFEQVCEQAGERDAWSFEAFHDKHRGHALAAIPLQ